MADFPAADAKKKKGRAPFDAAPHRAFVREQAAARQTHDAIAAALGVSVPTLRKHFAAELADRLPAANLFTAAPTPGDAAATTSAPPLPLSPAPKRPRTPRADGRRRWEPSPAQREEARLLIAANIRVEAIARRFGVSSPTVRRAFRHEFVMAYQAEMASLLLDMRKAARKGNVTAMVKLREALEAAELSRLSDKVASNHGAPAAPPPDSARPPAEDLGKKARAQADAFEAALTGDLADLLRPPPAHERMQ